MLYNRYSADKASPVSDLLRPEEIDEMMDLSDPDDLDLSTADQARFAEETVRRIDALGKFRHVGYGGC